MREYPDLLSKKEESELLSHAEWLWHALDGNNLGGYSDRNRPFYILHEFKAVIERYGRRDVGLHWSPQELENHPSKHREG